MNCEYFCPQHIHSHPEVFPSAFLLLMQGRKNMLIDSNLICVNMTFSANVDWSLMKLQLVILFCFSKGKTFVLPAPRFGYYSRCDCIGLSSDQAIAFPWMLELYLSLLSPGLLLPTLHLCGCMVSWNGGTNFLQHVVS